MSQSHEPNGSGIDRPKKPGRLSRLASLALVGLVLSGCSLINKSTPVPSIVPFAPSDALHTNLARLATAKGELSGSLSQGAASEPLTGELSIAAPSVSLVLQTGSPPSDAYDEIVSGGTRFLRLEGGPWINHGPADASTGLLAVLGQMDTTRDAGVKTIGGKQLHEIVVPMNGLDAGNAFGLWTANWLGLDDGNFRVWATDDGSVAGVGASIEWSQDIAGSRTDCKMEIDAVFETNPSVSITAPNEAWQVVAPAGAGIELALPPEAALQPDESPASYTITNGIVQVGGSLAYDTLDEMAKIRMGSKPDTDKDCYRANETARCLTAVTSNGGLAEMVAFQRGPWFYFVAIIGLKTDQSSLEATFSQILATLEFEDTLS